jgi:hypothetical protein
VADERDAAADARDAFADERDSLADAREAELDEREARLGISREDPGRFRAKRDQARARRDTSRQERERHRADRGTAATARGQAAGRRAAGRPATGLAMVFAEIARHLYDAVSLDDVLTRIAGASVSAVPGCEMASITVQDDDGTFRTVAFTHRAATVVDDAQYAAGQGPCLTAAVADGEAVVYSPSYPDPRWPALGAGPAEAGVHSSVSYSLTPSGPAADAIAAGSLNPPPVVAAAERQAARDRPEAGRDRRVRRPGRRPPGPALPVSRPPARARWRT